MSWIDRTRPLRRLISNVEARELRSFGRTGLSVLYDRRDIAVTAAELHGEARSAAWSDVTARWRALDRYQRVAGRTVPVFRLALR